jgi:hypothetical protein
MMPLTDPPGSRATSAISVAAAVMGGEGYAPVGPVLLASVKADERMAAPKGGG